MEISVIKNPIEKYFFLFVPLAFIVLGRLKYAESQSITLDILLEIQARLAAANELFALADFDSEIAALNPVLGSVSSTVNGIDGDVAFVSEVVAVQAANITRLALTNKICQSNFRIIANTFARIRKRVAFVVPLLSSG